MAVLPLPPEDFGRLPLWRRLAIRMLAHPVTFTALFMGLMIPLSFGIRWAYASYGLPAAIVIAVIIVIIGIRFEIHDRRHR